MFLVHICYIKGLFIACGGFRGLGPRKTLYLSVFWLDGGAVRSNLFSVIRSGAVGPSGDPIDGLGTVCPDRGGLASPGTSLHALLS